MALKPGYYVGTGGKEWLLRDFVALVANSERRAMVLTKVRVVRDPKKQVMTTASTNHSRCLAQMCGNSSSTAVITPSKPAN